MLVRAQGIHERPAHTRGIRTQRWPDPLRQPPAHVVEVLEHAAAGPIQVGAVFENYVDKRHAEKRVATHHFREGDGQHLRRDGIGHLVLDDLGGLTRIVREDDHLHIRQIGQRVERHRPHRIDPTQDDRDGPQEDENAIGDRPVDDAGQHPHLPGSAVTGAATGSSSETGASRRTASRRLLSESIRNCADTTT